MESLKLRLNKREVSVIGRVLYTKNFLKSSVKAKWPIELYLQFNNLSRAVQVGLGQEQIAPSKQFMGR